MRRYTTPEQVRLARLPPAVSAALEQALATEMQLAGAERYNPDDTGSVWLVERSDTDDTVAEQLGRPLAELPLEHVLHAPNQKLFIAFLVRNNSKCDSLIVPDEDWLPEAWAVALLANT